MNPLILKKAVFTTDTGIPMSNVYVRPIILEVRDIGSACTRQVYGVFRTLEDAVAGVNMVGSKEYRFNESIRDAEPALYMAVTPAMVEAANMTLDAEGPDGPVSWMHDVTVLEGG